MKRSLLLLLFLSTMVGMNAQKAGKLFDKFSREEGAECLDVLGVMKDWVRDGKSKPEAKGNYHIKIKPKTNGNYRIRIDDMDIDDFDVSESRIDFKVLSFKGKPATVKKMMKKTKALKGYSELSASGDDEDDEAGKDKDKEGKIKIFVKMDEAKGSNIVEAAILGGALSDEEAAFKMIYAKSKVPEGWSFDDDEDDDDEDDDGDDGWIDL